VQHESIAGRELLITILVIQAVVLAVASLTPNTSVPFDMSVYLRIADAVAEGLLPYRNVPLEYPPVVLVPILLPRLLAALSPVGGPEAFQAFFILFMGVTSLAMTVVTWRFARGWTPIALDPLRPVLYSLLLVALASPLLLWRYDLFPAILTLIALLLVGMAKPTAGGAVLGLAVAAKLYPVVLIPVFIAAYLATKDRAGVQSFLVGVLAAFLVIGVATFLLTPEAVTSILGYHLGRGVQLESTYAGLLQIGHLAGRAPATVTDQFDSLQIDSAWSPLALTIQPAVLIVLCVFVWAAAWLGFKHEVEQQGGLSIRTLISFLAAAVLAFMLGSRVLSPQFMIWLLPFAPFFGRGVFALVATCFALTFLIFPYLYGGLIALEPLPVALLNLRNVLLVVLMAVLVARPWRVPQESASTLPVLTEGSFARPERTPG
jgi:hypothetical protein